jgi:2-oxoglutarate ferredoxin oxidoreductase subunit beta
MSTVPMVQEAINPVEPFLRTERMPHIWCPGCGIGTTVNCFSRALVDSKLNLDKVAIVSGIGCTGRVAGYLRLDSFHTTHGRAIPFATGLKLANPDLTVVVYSGDGDLIAIGGNHFIHAARRNIDLKIVCINNFIYGMTGGQVAPTTPLGATATTSPYGCYERSMVEAFNKKGFSFIEIISPCPTLYQRRNKLGDGLDTMKLYKQKSVIKNGASTRDVDIAFGGEIIVGKFVDIERPTLHEAMDQRLRQVLKERYAGTGGQG